MPPVVQAAAQDAHYCASAGFVGHMRRVPPVVTTKRSRAPHSVQQAGGMTGGGSRQPQLQLPCQLVAARRWWLQATSTRQALSVASLSPHQKQSCSQQHPWPSGLPASVAWRGVQVCLKVTKHGIPPVNPQADLIEVGKIVSAHGIKGEVKIQIATDDPAQRFGKPGKT